MEEEEEEEWSHGSAANDCHGFPMGFVAPWWATSGTPASGLLLKAEKSYLEEYISLLFILLCPPPKLVVDLSDLLFLFPSTI